MSAENTSKKSHDQKTNWKPLPYIDQSRFTLNKTSTQSYFERKLGPGTYCPKMPELSQSFTFSISPRFTFETRIEKIVQKIQNQSREKGCKSEERFRTNLDLSLFTPERKLDLIKEKSKKASLKELITKKAKLWIEKVKKSKREKNFEEKFKKFEFRKHVRDAVDIKKTWTILIVHLAIIQNYKAKFEYETNRLFQLQRRLKLFTILVRWIGRLKIALRYARERNARKKLRKILRPYLVTWRIKRREKFLSCVTRTIEICLGRSEIGRIASFWILKIILIQRTFRKWRLIHCARLKALQYMWNKLIKTRKPEIRSTVETFGWRYIRIYLREKKKEYLQRKSKQNESKSPEKEKSIILSIYLDKKEIKNLIAKATAEIEQKSQGNSPINKKNVSIKKEDKKNPVRSSIRKATVRSLKPRRSTFNDSVLLKTPFATMAKDAAGESVLLEVHEVRPRGRSKR
ncbi:unnamed protein product [Blepharisma stoltei]|uniref:Protein TIC 214 n=1 Tax=Blepharisma stoltei TaxID=1481888 RepID=A0AAU9JNG0_9CILI|nr:unnamed protein product [Blepharisma stoltei]